MEQLDNYLVNQNLEFPEQVCLQSEHKIHIYNKFLSDKKKYKTKKTKTKKKVHHNPQPWKGSDISIVKPPHSWLFT